MILKRLSDKPLQPWELTYTYPASLKIDDAQKLIVEVGPGRGDFLYHLAEKHRDALVVAVEIKRKRIDRLVERIQKRGLTNVKLVQGDAREALPFLFDEGTLDEIHINFPDPWPKKRHTKNRLMNEEFLRTCTALLKTNGTMHFATDQDWYAYGVKELFTGVRGLEPCFDGGIAINPPDAFPTLFMQKWKDMGRTLHYQEYYKTKGSPIPDSRSR